MKFKLEELPSLLIFENGILLGQIDGYYTNDDKEIILNKIDDIINK